MTNIIETIGWLGFLLYLLAYLLLATKIITANFTYYLLNIIAALFVVIISVLKGTVQTIVINVIWGLISYLAIIKYRLKFSMLRPSFFRIWHITIFIISGFFVLIDPYWSVILFGWCSVFYFLDALLLYSNNIIKQSEFHIWNFLAAVTILPQLIHDSNWQVLVLEICWALFAVYGLIAELVIKEKRKVEL